MGQIFLGPYTIVIFRDRLLKPWRVVLVTDCTHFYRVKTKWINEFRQLLNWDIWRSLCLIDGYERKNAAVQLVSLCLTSKISEKHFLVLLCAYQTFFIVDEFVHVYLHIVENTTVYPILVEIFDYLDQFRLSHFFHNVVKIILYHFRAHNHRPFLWRSYFSLPFERVSFLYSLIHCFKLFWTELLFLLLFGHICKHWVIISELLLNWLLRSFVRLEFLQSHRVYHIFGRLWMNIS